MVPVWCKDEPQCMYKKTLFFLSCKECGVFYCPDCYGGADTVYQQCAQCAPVEPVEKPAEGPKLDTSLPKRLPIRRLLRTGFAMRSFAAAGLKFKPASAARPDMQQATIDGDAAGNAPTVAALAVLLLMAGLLAAAAPIRVRSICFVALAALGHFVAEVRSCPIWQYMAAAFLYALVLPVWMRYIQSRMEGPVGSARESVDCSSQTDVGGPGQPAVQININSCSPTGCPKTIVVAPNRGTRYHTNESCAGLREAKDRKTYTPCQICT